jgi:hypothetical protein
MTRGNRQVCCRRHSRQPSLGQMFFVDEEKYLDRKLIRVYTCTFAFSKV